MAIQNIGELYYPPLFTGYSTSAPAITTNTYVLDAAGEKAALIFRPTQAKAIRTIHARTATVTTGDTVDVRVETVNASGEPSGTLHGTNTNGALVIASSDDNVWKSVTLTADTATLTPGVSEVAVVIVNGGAGGNIQIGSWGFQRSHYPYGSVYTTSWTVQPNLPLIVVQYADGTFDPIYGYPATGGPITTTTFNSGTGTNRRGDIFTLAVPMRVSGLAAYIDADGPFEAKIYAADGTTVLATSDPVANALRGATYAGPHFVPFTSSVDLDAGVAYRMAVIPTSGTSVTTYEFDVPTAAMLDAFAGGQDIHSSTWNGSAWSETTTRRMWLHLIVTGLDDGAGGGGGLLVHPGMTGGIRG